MNVSEEILLGNVTVNVSITQYRVMESVVNQRIVVTPFVSRASALMEDQIAR